MKYRTIQTTIPARYKWLAVDADGEICVYAKKPEPEISAGFWIDSGRYAMQAIGIGPVPSDWTKTLRKLT